MGDDLAGYGIKTLRRLSGGIICNTAQISVGLRGHATMIQGIYLLASNNATWSRPRSEMHMLSIVRPLPLVWMGVQSLQSLHLSLRILSVSSDCIDANTLQYPHHNCEAVSLTSCLDENCRALFPV